MANLKPPPAPKKAASAPKVNQTIGTKPIRIISNGKLGGSHVGPKNAPFYEK